MWVPSTSADWSIMCIMRSLTDTSWPRKAINLPAVTTEHDWQGIPITSRLIFLIIVNCIENKFTICSLLGLYNRAKVQYNHRTQQHYGIHFFDVWIRWTYKKNPSKPWHLKNSHHAKAESDCNIIFYPQTPINDILLYFHYF